MILFCLILPEFEREYKLIFQAKIPQERKHDIAKDSSTGQIEGDKQNTTFEVDEEKLVK